MGQFALFFLRRRRGGDPLAEMGKGGPAAENFFVGPERSGILLTGLFGGTFSLEKSSFSRYNKIEERPQQKKDPAVTGQAVWKGMLVGMQNGRLFEMVYLLLERGAMTASELAEHFEVSVRTIYRDVDLLSGAGVPVYASRGKGGGIRLMEGYVLDRSLLTPGQQDEILFALQSLQATHALQAEELLSQLRGLFCRGQEEWIEVDFSPWGDLCEEREKFNLLKTAILERRPVAFDYHNNIGEKSERQVEPMKLCYKSGGWYLQGFCRLRQAARTFKICRIKRVQLLEGSFEKREMPPVDLQWTSSGGVLQVRLRFEQGAAHRICDELSRYPVRQEEDGSLTMTAFFPDDEWTVNYFLSFGTLVQVLSPEALRKAVRQKAEKIARFYEPGN
jgi:predicted DNA-binding transcriptional regulator YafY